MSDIDDGIIDYVNDAWSEIQGNIPDKYESRFTRKQIIAYYEAIAERCAGAVEAIKANGPAAQAVDRIISNLSARKGLGDVWDGISPDIRLEARLRWISYVEEALENEV